MDNEDSAASTGTAISAAVETHELQSERGSTPPTAPLSDQEKDIIDRQLTAPNLTVGYFSLFRYASTKDKLIMVVALISSIAAGAVMPLMTVSDRFPNTATQGHWNTVFFLHLPGILALLNTFPNIQTQSTTIQYKQANSAQLVYGNFAGSLTSYSVDATAAEMFERQINKFTLYFIYLGIATDGSVYEYN